MIYPRHFKRRLVKDYARADSPSLIWKGFEEIIVTTTEDIKVNTIEEPVVESVEQIKNVLSRVRARSNNRRLALKQLHKAHQLTIVDCERVVKQNERLCSAVEELREENHRLRTELAIRPVRVEYKKHWWSGFFRKETYPQRIGYLD